jgi:polysaccharide biosynthesis transport protein
MNRRESEIDRTLPVQRFAADLTADPIGADEGIDLISYWRVIRRRLWQILGLALAVGLLASLIAASLEPVYESSTTILVDVNRRGFSPVQEASSDGWYSYLTTQNYLQTQVLLLKSTTLAKSVAERSNLWDSPAFDPRQANRNGTGFRLDLSGLFSSAASESKAPSISEADARRAVVAQLASGVSAQVIRDSDMIRLSFTSSDPQLAARIASAYADAYLELGLETRLETVRKAASWLTGRLAGLKDQVDASERELQRFREQEGLVDIQGETNFTDKELGDLSQRLVEARAKKESLGNEFEQVRKLVTLDNAELASHPVVIRNPIIQALKTEEMQAERAASELAERYGAQHPKMVAARSDLATIRGKLRAEVANTVAGVKKEYDISNALVRQLEGQMEGVRSRAQEVNKKEFTLRSLKRNVEANRQLYDMFLTRFKETNLGADVESTNARIVDVAEVPGAPIKPRKSRIVTIAVVMALLLGVGLALLEDRLDNTLKSSDDVEGYTQLATLGTVPLRRGRKHARSTPERVLIDDAKSDFAEAVRTIRTGVVLSGLDAPHRIVLVTSTVPGEGKTTIASNLAVALSQLERVLLIDGDLRRASIGTKLGLSPSAPGLSNLVAGTAKLDDCVHRLSGTELDVLPAGLVPPNPLELLSSQHFAQTLADLEGRYDRLVIDSAPAQAVSDALILSRMCNAVVFVIKADSTPKQLVQVALKRLHRVDAPLIGAVLNQFDSAGNARYGHYRYGRYSRYSKAYTGYSQYYSEDSATG